MPPPAHYNAQAAPSQACKVVPTYGQPYLETREFIRLRREVPVETLRATLMGRGYAHVNFIEDECRVQLRLRHSADSEPHFVVRGKDEAAIHAARDLIFELLQHTLRDAL